MCVCVGGEGWGGGVGGGVCGCVVYIRTYNSGASRYNIYTLKQNHDVNLATLMSVF